MSDFGVLSLLGVCVRHCFGGIPSSVAATSSVAGQALQALHGDWKTARSAPLPACSFQLGLGIDYNLGKERISIDILE